jgi:hypothetical protein
MAQLDKIDSNVTGLRYAVEQSIGVLPGSPVWIPLEPNGYSDFGGQLTTIARNPINAGRQRKKGVVTDLDASGGFGTDLTQENMQDLLQSFMFAQHREKGREIVTAVDVDTTNPDEYEVALTAGFKVGDLIIGKNFTNAANNALNEVTAITTDVSVEVADGVLVTETPPADAEIFVVGTASAAGDLDVDAAGQYPAITSTTLDFTTLGLIPGEWIFVGGDTGGAAGDQFLNAANNGFKRVRTIAANRLEFDKSSTTMVTEANTAELVRLFFGRVLKNEADPTLQVRQTIQMERTLGAPDDASPANIQAEYLPGSVANEFSFNIPTADKMTADLSFVSLDNTQIDGPTALKSGTRPSLVEADAFNTSSDFSRIKMNIHTDTNENPDPLFAFVTEVTLTINNTLTPNKAIGVLGAFEVTAGQFVVNGNVTAYFSNVAAVQAVRNNADVTLDMHLVKSNAGISIDVPMIALGEGRLSVEQDAPITLPLSLDAATAANLDTNMDHTLLIVFYDYLPSAADV